LWLITVLILLAGSIISHRVDTAVVLAALFLFGVNETFADTATTTLPPMLVNKRDLGIANSRSLAGMNVGSRLAGPPVGAALFTAGTALPFISETVCVLAGVLLITRIRLPARAGRAEATRVRDEIRQGWQWLWAHHAVRVLAITIFNVQYHLWCRLVGPGPVRAGPPRHGRGGLRPDHDPRWPWAG